MFLQTDAKTDIDNFCTQSRFFLQPKMWCPCMYMWRGDPGDPVLINYSIFVKSSEDKAAWIK